MKDVIRGSKNRAVETRNKRLQGAANWLDAQGSLWGVMLVSFDTVCSE